MTLVRALLLSLVAALPLPAAAQLTIEITRGNIQPIRIAVPVFVAETPGAAELAQDIADVVVADLESTGLFTAVPRASHIASVSSFSAPVAYADWSAINVAGLVTGSVSTEGDRVIVRWRLWDIDAREPLTGLQVAGDRGIWRRLAHKVADGGYSRVTGEDGYFDSRVVFVSESGPKDARVKRLAVMDSDGANLRYLTNGSELVLGPRFSPTARDILYTSYATGEPRIMLMNLETLATRPLTTGAGTTFAPRFSPDGTRVVFSQSVSGNTDLYVTELATGATQRLTTEPSIETAPSFSPDGRQIVFESDRSGGQQIYVMPAAGGAATRISAGAGRYGTPVWSPRGDLIAFTKINQGRFHIGVMRTDGSRERLLTASTLDEGPTWSANGRVLMFFRDPGGDDGAPRLWSVDITGRALRQIDTPAFASDPSWSGLLN